LTGRGALGQRAAVSPDEVRVELVAPEAIAGPELAWCEALLGAEERERAARIRVAGGRRRFVVAHALARCALSRAAPVEPGAWRFRRGPHGKPEVTEPSAASTLRFNLSHTAGLAACAVTEGVEVGVDAEAGARLGDPLPLALRFFAASEVEALRALEGEARRQRFLDLWSLKEALLKALGVGLAGRIARVSFAVEEGRPRLLDAGDLGGDPRDWQLALLRPTPSHRVALALRRGRRSDLSLALCDPAPLRDGSARFGEERSEPEPEREQRERNADAEAHVGQQREPRRQPVAARCSERLLRVAGDRG
jgi:4'-phosphopantetheinyl transferase